VAAPNGRVSRCVEETRGAGRCACARCRALRAASQRKEGRGAVQACPGSRSSERPGKDPASTSQAGGLARRRWPPHCTRRGTQTNRAPKAATIGTALFGDGAACPSFASRSAGTEQVDASRAEPLDGAAEGLNASHLAWLRGSGPRRQQPSLPCPRPRRCRRRRQTRRSCRRTRRSRWGLRTNVHRCSTGR
jgi:hypothetical protein